MPAGNGTGDAQWRKRCESVSNMESVKTDTHTAVGRRTELECIKKIAEFLLCLFVGKTEKLEHSVLKLGVCNTD